MNNLPEIFCIAKMVPQRRYCYAHALWVNQAEKAMRYTESRYGMPDEGGLSFNLEPFYFRKYLQNQVKPVNRISRDRAAVDARNDARCVITDGMIRNLEWCTTGRNMFPSHGIKRGDSSIPVRFKPVLMEFASGCVEQYDQAYGNPWEGEEAWNQATDWRWGTIFTAKEEVIHGYCSQEATLCRSASWDKYLTAAAHCWRGMSFSQIKVELGDSARQLKPTRLRDVWSYYKKENEIKVRRWDEAGPVIEQILSSLAPSECSQPCRQTSPAIEKAIYRAARKGRVTKDRVRNLMALLATGNAIVSAPNL